MTGAEKSKGREGRGDDAPLSITLFAARWRHFAWGLFFLALGAAIAFLSTSAFRWLGMGLCLWGSSSAYAFVRTLMHPAGTLYVGEGELGLPTALCSGSTLEVPMSQVKHAYYLRRAVPWTKSGPILVIETAQGRFEYPRDWFATDEDHRRVGSAINRRLGRW